MSKDMTWPQAIEAVLRASGSPLHYKEITNQIISNGLKSTFGATPDATVLARITSSIKALGPKSPYVRVTKGLFTLRSLTPEQCLPAVDQPTSVEIDQEEREPQYDIISSFGMFWRRKAVNWKAAPKLLGKRRAEANTVDFNRQLGIYLLYDGREVIYIGRAMKESLGQRLHYHTIDRMAARWDKFSWFGLRHVAEDGSLGNSPTSYDASKIVPTLEAILIEALEPRQNRRAGDDLSDVEYIQVEDEEIQKKLKKKIVAEMMENF